MQEIRLGDVDLFMGRYDKNGDKRLLFSEFTKAFTPQDDYYSKKLSSKNAHGELQEKTKFLYRNLWHKHFQVE